MSSSLETAPGALEAAEGNVAVKCEKLPDLGWMKEALSVFGSETAFLIGGSISMYPNPRPIRYFGGVEDEEVTEFSGDLQG